MLSPKLNTIPVVSVLMSVYNGEQFLQESIQSILCQSFKNFEFLIIDDASTDRSKDIIQKVSVQDSRVRLIENPQRLGLTRSLNIGIKQAQGKYIARQDADDISFGTRLARQVTFLEAHPDYALVGTKYEEIDEQSRVVSVQRVPFVSENEEIQRIKYQFNPFTHSSVTFRKDSADAVGGYNEIHRYAQDYEFWLRLLQTQKGHILPEVLNQRRYMKSMISFHSQQLQLWSVIRTKVRYLNKFGWTEWGFFFRDILRWIRAFWVKKL